MNKKMNKQVNQTAILKIHILFGKAPLITFGISKFIDQENGIDVPLNVYSSASLTQLSHM
jgi:hypothetical protein